VSIVAGHRSHQARPTRSSGAGGRGARLADGVRHAVRAVATRRPGFAELREVALLAVLWTVYSASRMLADNDLAQARGHASTVLDIERFLHLDIESWLNHAVTPVSAIAVPASFWYASLHYLVTPSVLLWLYLRHRSEYSRARNAIVAGSALALACYVLLPMAPPRLMPGGGYLDTLAATADSGWWSDHASAPAGLGHLTNELAAMPSLHVGWTVWVAWALWHHLRLPGRVVASSYVAGTTFVVIATGNHWVLDAVGGALVIALGVVLTSRTGAGAQGARGAQPRSGRTTVTPPAPAPGVPSAASREGASASPIRSRSSRSGRREPSATRRSTSG